MQRLNRTVTRRREIIVGGLPNRDLLSCGSLVSLKFHFLMVQNGGSTEAQWDAIRSVRYRIQPKAVFPVSIRRLVRSIYWSEPRRPPSSNTARLRLIPIACWRVDDIRFAFDSSFIAPDSDATSTNDIRVELAHLADLVKAHPGCPLSVFGHADPTGNDDYNKALSGRRATAVYALLIANADPGKP